jgi:hypothetical protein
MLQRTYNQKKITSTSATSTSAILTLVVLTLALIKLLILATMIVKSLDCYLANDLFEDGGDKIGSVEMTTSGYRTILHIDGGDFSSGFEKKGGCNEDGWTTVGKGNCLTRNCVVRRLEQAYEDAGDLSVGQCVDTRTERRVGGARVCRRVVEDC